MTDNFRAAFPVDGPGRLGHEVDRAFVFTDIEGSSKLMEREEEECKLALAMHDALLREVFIGAGAEELAEAGDGFLFAFADPAAALGAAVRMQQGLDQLDWPEATGPLAVRVALGFGAATPLAHGEYRGLVLNRTARLLGAAHGGQVLCGKAFAAVAGGAAELRELGWYHLRDLSQPEQVYQVFWPGMRREDFPPLRTPPVVPCNLPRTFDAFFGRQEEISRLRELLAVRTDGSDGAKRARLVTLTGPGGTGKTRLGIETGQVLRGVYAEAVWFIPLADLTTPELLPMVFRDALKLPTDAPVAPKAQVLGFLSARPGLLVVDNFEQLLPAGADFVVELIESAPELRLLVSSRCRLGVPGEREFAVPELPYPAEGASEEEIRESVAAQLFEDRARAVRAEFALAGANAQGAAAVCRALEGVPLAIELAASRADVVSPQAMVAELKQRLDFCRRNDPRLPPRHRSLRAAIDWSYEFLPVALREFFENLSVFRGGFTGEAAAAVAQSGALVATAGDPRRALSELRSASLVRVDTAHAGMRFALIETIREYAAEKLALRSDAPEIAEKHARFFMELTKQVEKHTGTPEEPEWRARLYAEAENLRAAMESDAEVETLATLVRDLPGDWPTEGRSAEYLRWVETCLRREDGLSEKPRAYLNSTAGQAYTALGDYARGRLYHEKALRFYRSVHDDSNIAGALCNLARIDVGEGDFASAEARTADGALLFERIGETAKAAQAFANLGGILCFQGQFDRARAAFEKSLTLLGESAALGVRSLIECGLAEIAFFAGDYRSANARALEGLALAVSVRDVHGLAEASTLLACISFADGRQGEAARWLGALDALSVVIEEVASKPLLGALHSVRQGLPASLAELAEETAAGKRMARKWTARRFS